MAPRPRIFTIPAAAPFLPTLIAALADGRLIEGFPEAGDPLSLPTATLYLPTRRACRLARDVFLDVLEADAALLPRFVAIGDIDEDELVFSEFAGGAALDLPDAIGGLERKLLLAQLILKWAQSADVRTQGGVPLVAGTPGAALSLADDLARLIDDMTTRKVAWNRLDSLVPENFDQYWQLTLKFLKIAREFWPAMLAERAAIDMAERRDRLIAAEAERLKAHRGGPVIAAGSTASMPSTATLLSAIASLPQGAVVLPGLDIDLDDASWDRIGGETDGSGREIAPPVYGHPQFGMHAFLRSAGVARGEVTLLGGAAGRHARLVSEALRPAGSTDLWRERLTAPAFQAAANAGAESIAVIEAGNSEDEALAIAVALREAVENGLGADHPPTAALITPDRALARRVLAALERWAVPVDDSGGDRLSETPAGIFARLAAQAALGGTEPVTLLALLKHPLCRLGGSPGTGMADVALLERAVLRGPRPRAGTAGLAGALETLRRNLAENKLHPRDPRSALSSAEIDIARALVSRLAEVLAPLERAGNAALPVRDLAARHRNLLAALSHDEAFAGDDGEALARILEEMASRDAAGHLALEPVGYPDFFREIAGDIVVRRPGAPGARVRILGPLEARLQSADRVVLAGLNEATWPPEPKGDPWLSRPMRRALGLDLPERRIGLAAHDFAQALGARDVILTRAAKVEGSPAVASRFLQRLAAVMGEARWSRMRARGQCYLDWAHALDFPAVVTPAKRPEPRPKLDARPKALSVTEIEHWLRDPYTIYARHILKLNRLDPVDMAVTAAERGSAIHDAVEEFTRTFAAAWPADPLGELLAIGRRHFAPLDDYPQARAFWWPRFVQIAQWFVAWEEGRRPQIAESVLEVQGRMPIRAGAFDFTLSARADRIDRLSDGRFAILDYKTGNAPTDKQVRIGLSPQLTLEAAILRAGCFPDIPAGVSISEISYVELKGANERNRHRTIKLDDLTPDQAADYALRRLQEMIARFADERQPYRSLNLTMWKSRYGTYDDLARVKEWSATGGEAEGGDE
ncbi:MAG: double-strand break repair protein AddB [Pseudorhodoplanes sp.]|nr:double-strand break repair protein AddB [Pseudorhodoplanes sp.]